jgi:hypothetical protein
VKSSRGKREASGERRGDARNSLFEILKKYTLQKNVKSSGGTRETNGERNGAGSDGAMRETVFLKLEKITLCKGR